MFARILEFSPKPEKRNELIRAMRQDILPILKKQPGFLELIPFVPEDEKGRMVAVSLWNDTREAQRYVDEAFTKVEQILGPCLSGPITVSTFTVDTSVCRHLVDALLASA